MCNTIIVTNYFKIATKKKKFGSQIIYIIHSVMCVKFCSKQTMCHYFYNYCSITFESTHFIYEILEIQLIYLLITTFQEL